MYIRDISIKNFKSYKNCQLILDEGLNLLIGDNGVGKTSALSAVSNLLACIIKKLSREDETKIWLEDVNMDITSGGESVIDIKYNYPVVISGDICGTDSKLTVAVSRNENLGLQIDSQMSEQKILEMCNGRYPLFSFQKFDREWKTPDYLGENKVVVQTGMMDRMEGYTGCLYGTETENKIQQWCLKMSIMEYEKKGTIKEFRTFQNIIKRFMQIIEDTEEDFKVSYSMKLSSLVYETDSKSIPLYELSTGYRALLAMIMELAYRTVILNPDISEDLEDLPGIVLVDEVDAHLHPKWQWSILDALHMVFPKVQFIIGTHSPIVISSAKNARIIALNKGEEVNYLDSAYGFSIGDVLTLRQGSNDMPEESKRFYSVLENAIDEADMKRAQLILSKAKDVYGETSAFYQELKQYYDLNCLIEE